MHLHNPTPTCVFEGAYAEYASVPEDLLANIPTNLTFTEAAALPLASLSAFQAWTENLLLSPNTSDLIEYVYCALFVAVACWNSYQLLLVITQALLCRLCALQMSRLVREF